MRWEQQSGKRRELGWKASRQTWREYSREQNSSHISCPVSSICSAEKPQSLSSWVNLFSLLIPLWDDVSSKASATNLIPHKTLGGKRWWEEWYPKRDHERGKEYDTREWLESWGHGLWTRKTRRRENREGTNLCQMLGKHSFHPYHPSSTTNRRLFFSASHSSWRASSWPSLSLYSRLTPKPT